MVQTHAGLAAPQLDQLRRSFAGEIITPDHTEYDGSRRLWNDVFDLRPAAIVRPTTTTEVATALRFARDHDLELAIRSGGHSPSGHSSCDGGLVIDMSAMRGVTVDGERRTARANGGALLGELDVAAQAHGLVCPVGVIGHTGVAGLTLGGGIGRLQRNFGLTIDNLAAVELVTADGRVVRTSETEEPELFWGVRGAGWNYGIATGFDFRLQPFGPNLNRSVRIYRGSDVHEVWALFRDYAANAPDTVSFIFSIAMATPAADYPDSVAGGPIALIGFNHSGSADTVERDTAGLRRGPEPVAVTEESRAYLDIQTAHDLVLGWGHRSFIKGVQSNDLRAESIDELVDLVASGAPGDASFSVTAQGGAIARVADDATAFTGRGARFDLSADSTWDDPELDEANRDWVRRAMAIVEPDATEGRYANENADTGPEETRAIYGDAKLARLAALKRTWDPENVFRRNHNVAPAAADGQA
ncbi:MAG: FAD-binding oxidoreductase [Chloroflexota bacterium]